MTTQLQPKVELTVGERLTLPQFSNYRTLYPIYEAGNLLAFVGTQTGWGKPWRLYPLERLAKVTPTQTQLDGFAPDSAEWVNVVSSAGSYLNGKDENIAAALAMLRQKRHRDKFRTVPELHEREAKKREANQRLAADRLASAITTHAHRIEEHELILQLANAWSKGHAVGKRPGDLKILDRMLTELTASTKACERIVEDARDLVQTFEGKKS